MELGPSRGSDQKVFLDNWNSIWQYAKAADMKIVQASQEVALCLVTSKVTEQKKSIINVLQIHL